MWCWQFDKKKSPNAEIIEIIKKEIQIDEEKSLKGGVGKKDLKSVKELFSW